MKRVDLSRPLAAGYCALTFALGAGTTAAYSAYLQHRVSYNLVVAGADPTAAMIAHRYHTLVDAESMAHDLLLCPETEQEKGCPILILDQDGRLVDTITRA